jgi:hypothetical protein
MIEWEKEIDNENKYSSFSQHDSFNYKLDIN